ncbi:MAG: hypothetical protein GXO21_04250 [Aquificae bacterium]|nr:hypothetical protein [Aquificota bacterium]
MKNFRVIWERKAPISYISPVGDGTTVEKIGFNKDGSIVKIPVVKGSHFRGRFRRWIARKILLENLHKIEKEKDFKKRLAVATALFYSGSIVKGYELTEKNVLKIKEILSKEDKFGKYFGYMIKDLDNERSRFIVGHAYPAILGYNVKEGENIEYVVSDSFQEIRIKTDESAKAKWFDITYPLTVVIGGRKAGVLDEISKVIKEKNLPEEYLKEVEDFLDKQSKSEKTDTQNLLYEEVINSGFDLIQELAFEGEDIDEKDITAILTAYYKFFNEIEPFIGGKVVRGFGRIEKMEIEGFTPDENALDEFIKSIDLKTITDIVELKEEK